MFVSIIIPVYNCEKYLADCLDSCVNQDLAANEYEILCINDGSTDSSLDILNDYADKYSNIKVFSQENKGVSAARNVGLDNAKGDYIMFVDGDDLIRANILNTIKKAVLKTGCKRLLMDGYICYSDTAELFKTTPIAPNYSKVYFNDLLWLCVFDRKTIEQNHIRFIEGIANSEDVLFVLDFKNICNECYELSEAFYFYRRHSNSAVDRNNTENLKKMIRSYIKLVVLCKTRMEDPQYNAKLNYEFWNRHMAYILRYISELPYNERRVVLSELKASKPYLPVNKTNRNRIDKSIIRSIRRSNTLRRIEVANYANHIGAHLISARRKLEDTALGYIIKHPRRVIKNPIGFIKTMKNNNKRRKEAN